MLANLDANEDTGHGYWPFDVLSSFSSSLLMHYMSYSQTSTWAWDDHSAPYADTSMGRDAVLGSVYAVSVLSNISPRYFAIVVEYWLRQSAPTN